MQGNKKLIFLRKSSQSDRPLEKTPHKTLLFEIRSSEIQKIWKRQKKKQQPRLGGPAFLETSDNRTTKKKNNYLKNEIKKK